MSVVTPAAADMNCFSKWTFQVEPINHPLNVKLRQTLLHCDANETLRILELVACPAVQGCRSDILWLQRVVGLWLQRVAGQHIYVESHHHSVAFVATLLTSWRLLFILVE